LMKTYLLRPFMTAATQSSSPAVGKPAVPPKQPLLSPVVDPTRPRLCLGLDVHLKSIMAVAQRDHGGRRHRRSSPRPFGWGGSFTREQIGSCTGCCPGEHSSGGKRRIGSIDREGPQGCALTPVRCAQSAVALRQE
jgi:hypothetical protein